MADEMLLVACRQRMTFQEVGHNVRVEESGRQGSVLLATSGLHLLQMCGEFVIGPPIAASAEQVLEPRERPNALLHDQLIERWWPRAGGRRNHRRCDVGIHDLAPKCCL